MKLKNYIILMIFVSIIASCRENKTEKLDVYTNISAFCKNEYDSIIIPSLNIEHLNANSDQKEIRILEQAFIYKFGRLFIIKETSLGWKCFRYNFLRTSTDDFYVDRIDTFNVESITPKSGWNTFINKIDSINLSSFTEQSDIQGWKEKDISDGTYYLLEFNYNKSHDCFYYHCPDLYTEYKNSKQMTDLIEIFKEEVEFDNYKLPAAAELEMIIKRNKKSTSNK